MLDILKLIKRTEAVTDEYGDTTEAEEAREVFCSVKSIGMKEFYQANALGLKPEITFELADALDYEAEKLVEHEGKRYKVLRTYKKGQGLELTCYSEVNQNGNT